MSEHAAISPVSEVRRTLAEVERCYIEQVLAETDGNISEAARILGIYRSSLQRRLRRYGRGDTPVTQTAR